MKLEAGQLRHSRMFPLEKQNDFKNLNHLGKSSSVNSTVIRPGLSRSKGDFEILGHGTVLGMVQPEQPVLLKIPIVLLYLPGFLRSGPLPRRGLTSFVTHKLCIISYGP